MAKSIMQEDTGICIVCGRPYAEEHHVVYGRGLRELSEKYGLKVGLCEREHRRPKTGVHGGNRELDLELKREAQRVFTIHYPELDFLTIFGKNYL